MTRILGWVVFFPFVILMSGCAHKSYHPWLGEDLLIKDDSMAGVWQGIDDDGENIDETDLFIVRPAVKLPGDGEKPPLEEVLTGYYAVTWIDNDSVEMPATIEEPILRPKNLLAGVYRIGDTLLAQMWGSTIGGESLVSPMHVIYRTEMQDGILTLYDLQLEDLEPGDLLADGLLFEAKDDDPVVFFSPTETMTRFIEKHLDEEGFFNPEPSLKLKRIRDLSGLIAEETLRVEEPEILQPVN